MNQDEFLKCLDLSKERYSQGDFEGSLRMAIKAKRMFDCPETSEWLEKVKTSAENTKSPDSEAKESTKKTENNKYNESSNVRKRTKSQENYKTVSSDASYTPEQEKEVKEFMKRNKNDYYVILGVQKSASLEEIKKSYKKLALKFHPDKNQAPGADEAFKIIAVAFSVLGDEEKRRNFDRFGSSGSNFNNSTAGFSSNGANFSFRGENISPEDLFNMFFQTAFAQQRSQTFHSPFGNVGVPPGGFGFQFGGPGQAFFSTNFNNAANQHPFQRRQRTQQTPNQGTENEEIYKKLVQFIPLIIVFVFSIISSWIFPNDSSPNQSTDHLFSLNPSGSHRFPRSTRLKHVPYYATYTFQNYFQKLKENDTTSKLYRDLMSYENIIEGTLLKELRKSCDIEERKLAQLLKNAKKEQIEEIKNNFKLNSCDKLKQFS